MNLFIDLSKDRLAQLVCQLFVLSFFSAYILYCVQADGRIFLPSLSSTWDFKPGNFLSRWSIGVGCVGLYLIQIICWKGHKLSSWLHQIAFYAVFCLSVVGAVCSSENSLECRGNKEIHYAAAGSFFVLFDSYMAIVLFKLSKSEEKALEHEIYIKISFVISVLSKIRMLDTFGSHGHKGSFPWFSVWEYLNVAAIISFNLAFTASITKSLRFSLARLSVNDNLEHHKNVLWAMSGNNTLQIALRYATGTLLSCLVTALIFKTTDPDEFPMISDTFVYPPGNYISRWAGIIGCTYLQLANFCLYHCYSDHMNKNFARLCGLISTVSTLGLSVVVVVSETEDRELHFPAAITFFGGYLILIGLVPIGLLTHSKTTDNLKESLLSGDKIEVKDNVSKGVKLFALIFIVSAISKIRYCTALMSNLHFPTIDEDVRSVIAIFEWMDAMAILAFLFSMFVVFPEGLKKSQYIVRVADSTESTLI